ncbi:MAG: glycosyltransferase family 41 protein [Bradyrhizobiaceae bacterium]|nr:MAG: glycosyltransferase family 41 protein [Bradyrhizobiaceae bacterium]
MQPSHVFTRAVTAFQKGQLDTSERAFQKFLQHEPEHFGALNLYAALLIQQKRFAEAEPFLQKAISIDARSDKTFYNYGLVLKALGKPEQAMAAFHRSLSINPAESETWNNVGTVHNDLKQYRDAVTSFDKAIALSPHYAEAHFNKGRSLCFLGEPETAFKAFQQATRLKPDMGEAWYEIATLSCLRGNFAHALSAVEKAISLKPDNQDAYLGKAIILAALNREIEAFEACQTALKLRPDFAGAKAHILRLKLTVSDWSDYTTLARDFVAEPHNFQSGIAPFLYFTLPTTSSQQLIGATSFSQNAFPVPFSPIATAPGPGRQKIKVAYLSADFREHPTTYLLAGTIEHHDRERFEVIGFSTITETPLSEPGQRIKNAFDDFHDISTVSDADVASLVHRLGVDLLIDLGGYTQDMRAGILVRRPAPVQVNYLGFPGTMGASFIDYIVADRTVIPESDQAFYSEKIAWLPHTYQPNDDTRPLPRSTAARTDLGLPASGVVYCCFNNSFKITPDIFDVWMRLLRQVEGSVLWLLEANPTAKANLRKEAEARGVPADRLVFAPRVSTADHLARHVFADIFLDTLYYNAHTTASDALWAGLPVITYEGQTFASRVASSLLRAVGLPELITTSVEDYEALALKLAQDPVLLASIKAKLAENRLTAPLFDTAQYTRHLEAAYITMYERALRGEKPASFAVQT